MSLQNLSEDNLYDLLPQGIIDLDEQGLIQAVVGGFQDRVDDLRSYVSKFELLMTGNGVPETDDSGNPVNNVVLCQIQSPQGKVYNRSLEFTSDTPANGTAALVTWAAGQLQLDEDHVLLSAAYGVDALRLVDANILAYLASTIGAVLYQTAAMDPDNAHNDARRLIQTWFPRLQFKGTAQSFETLGRLLGFDDVRMMPLFGRLSPRIANDIGDAENNQDFAVVPDYFPKQARDNFYDPWALNDGPFFTWTGTASALFGTNDTSFYTQIVNGFNPFVSVNVVGTAPTNPAAGQYILIGGGPETPASVEPPGSGLLFKAISAGSSFNGLQVNVTSIDNGTYAVLSITDRLSSIKYRTSYYDLALTLDVDHALSQFGTNVASANKDLVDTPALANFGTVATSPFRPWTSGSLQPETVSSDWLVKTVADGTLSVVTPRTQADLTSREFDVESISTAGAQVVQAMEEVRPATRKPRQVNTGLLIRDQIGYASYCAKELLFTTAAPVSDIIDTVPVANNELFGFFTYYDIPSITSLTFNQTVSNGGFDIESMSALTSMDFPNLTDIDPSNTQLAGLTAAANTALTSISAPLLQHVGYDVFLWNNTAQTTFNMSAIVTVGHNLWIENCPIPTLSFPNLISVGQSLIIHTLPITTLALNALTTVTNSLEVQSCTSLTSASFPSLTTITNNSFNWQNNTSLTSVSIPNLVINNGFQLSINACALNVTTVNALLAQCVSFPGFVSGVVNLSGGTNAAPTGQGLTDKATLITRGVNVLTN